MHTIISPKRPAGHEWRHIGISGLKTGYESHSWFHPKTRISVISAVEVAEGVGTNQIEPQYHISIAVQGVRGIERCQAEVAKWVCEQFGMADALEDNHTARVARSQPKGRFDLLVRLRGDR